MLIYCGEKPPELLKYSFYHRTVKNWKDWNALPESARLKPSSDCNRVPLLHLRLFPWHSSGNGWSPIVGLRFKNRRDYNSVDECDTLDSLSANHIACYAYRCSREEMWQLCYNYYVTNIIIASCPEHETSECPTWWCIDVIMTSFESQRPSTNRLCSPLLTQSMPELLSETPLPPVSETTPPRNFRCRCCKFPMEANGCRPVAPDPAIDGGVPALADRA